MLHSFYREFLTLKQPPSLTPADSATNCQQAMRQLMLERLAASQGGRGCAEQLADAFARSVDCPCCGLAGGGSGSVGEFAKWRATTLRRIAVHEAVIGCWVRAMAAPFDWAWIRRSKACLCPFIVPWSGGGGSGGAFVWRPAAVESTCLLLAQTCSIGVDLYLRVGGGEALIPCHSFLMGSFVQMYRSGSWPSGSLRKEAGRLVLELDAKRYSPELLQFVFYSAYGHVLCLADSQSPTCQELATIRSILSHLIEDTGSLCRHLVDASSLVTNVMVILDRLVRSLQPMDPSASVLMHELLLLFRISRLFDDLRQRLKSRICAEVGRHLSETSEKSCKFEQQLSCLHRCSDSGRAKDCLVTDLAAEIFSQLVLEQRHPEAKLEVGIQAYLSSLVHLYETNRRDAMVKVCRDLRCISGIITLIGAPCSTRLARMRGQLAHLCQTLMLLVCDQALISFADTLCYHGDGEPVELLTSADFQFAAAFSQSAITALSRSSTGEAPIADDLQVELSPESLSHLRKSLCQPDITAMLDYQTSRGRLEKLQVEVAEAVSSRELRAVAYSSYTAGRLPQLRSLVQAVALLAGGDKLGDDEEKLDETSRVQLCSDGRRILCTEGGLAAALKAFNPDERALARLLRGGRETRWKFLTELDATSKCNYDLEQKQQCSDHGEIVQACIIFRWVREATRCLAFLRQTQLSAEPPSYLLVSGDLKEAIGRFVAAHREFFQRQADELLSAGELEPDRYRQLAAATVVTTPTAASGASVVAGEDEDGGASRKDEDTAFVMHLLPNLHFKFEPLNSHGH